MNASLHYFSIFLLFVGLLSSVIFFILIGNLLWSTPFYKKIRDEKTTQMILSECAKYYSKRLEINPRVNIYMDFVWPKSNFEITGQASKLQNRKNSYVVRVFLNNNIYTLISTMAHELIHVKQMDDGDLETKDDKNYWKGVDHTETSYLERPWEIEAFKYETQLANEFMNLKKMKYGPLLLKISNFLSI